MARDPSRLQPIVTDISLLSHYPFEAIGPSALAWLEQISASIDGVGENYSKNTRLMLRIFDCVLAICGLRLDKPSPSPHFLRCVRLTLGAINSTSFLSASYLVRYTYSRCLVDLANRCAGRRAIFASPESQQCSPALRELALEFEAQPWIEERVWYRRGWLAFSKLGKPSWLDFQPVYRRYGRTFVESLHAACVEYCGTRRAPKEPPGLKLLVTYLCEVETPPPEQLRDPSFTRKFLERFADWFLTTGLSTAKLQTRLNLWNNQFRTFYNNHLAKTGPFCRMTKGLWKLERNRGERHAKTSNAKSRKISYDTLLAPVPKELLRSAIISFLYEDLPKAVEHIVEAARAEAETLYANAARRKELSSQARPRTIGPFMGPRGKPSELKKETLQCDYRNMLAVNAATFEAQGYVASEGKPALLYPRPLPDTAVELGLPTANSLLAYATLLVEKLPQITDSYLEVMELYDINGKIKCIKKTDDAYYLCSNKYRKHAKSYTELAADEEVLGIIMQVIVVTMPLREYLRKIGDEKWRLLFLTRAGGFSIPNSIRFSVASSAPKYLERISGNLQRTRGLSRSSADNLTRRFSLRSLRNTIGVIKFTQVTDPSETSRLLGQEFSHDLLSRYIPPEIVSFIRQYSIRVVQTNLVLLATRDSKWQLPASGFNSAKELDDFLKEHTLPDLAPLDAEAGRDESVENIDSQSFYAKQVLFPFDKPTCAVLTSIQKTAQNMNDRIGPTGKYWVAIANAVLDFAKRSVVHRPDFGEILVQGENSAATISVIGALRE